MSETPKTRRSRAFLAGITCLLLAGCAGGEGGSTGLGLNLVSASETQQAGLTAWKDIRSKTAVSDNAAHQATLRRVSSKLLTAAGQNPAGWEMVVFKGDTANAFALPGNKIGIYEGLFQYAKDEPQLAAVVGHEIAHNLQNHAQQRLSDAAATQLGAQVLAVAIGAGTGMEASQIAGLLGAGAEYGLILPYARNQELEADRDGLMMMARAGYDPRGAVALWRNMSTIPGARPPAFLSTHPGTEDRIAQLERLMPEALATYQKRG